nr:hypothetical protein [Tanacetum cinerariifolium]
MPSGIGSSGVKVKSISSIKESLSSTGIGDGEKDLISALEFSEKILPVDEEMSYRTTISISLESSSSSSMLGGIGSSKVKVKSMSSIIGDGEKDSISALEFSETNSSGGRGDELSYNNLWERRISFSG